MRRALGFVRLFDVKDGGWDYHYQVYGTSIAEQSSFDATDKLVSELLVHPMGAYFGATYHACVVSSSFMFPYHVPPVQVYTTSRCRIILPLEGDDGVVSRLLVGNIPGAWVAHR